VTIAGGRVPIRGATGQVRTWWVRSMPRHAWRARPDWLEEERERGQTMEHLGSHYVVVLHDPVLRDRLITEAGSRVRSSEKSGASAQLCLRLARTLRGVAMRVALRIQRGAKSIPRQPVLVE
jgi:hypothetical protein